MHSKRSDKTEHTLHGFVHPLKGITAREFAALGSGEIVFVREISGGELSRFIPEVSGAPDDADFHLVMSADGAPLLVTDGIEAVVDWLEAHPVQVVALH